MGEWFSSLSGALSPFFLNPAIFIPGALLVASPIIIHLLNRLKFRKIRFAAMEFLLKSQKRNKRRILLEQLLLLMMRVLMVLLIAALIARMVLDPNQLALLQGEKSHHLVLLDDSLSMRDRWGTTSAFDEGLTVVRKIAEEGARRPGTQRLTVLRLSNPDEPVINGEELNEQFLIQFIEDLERFKCTHQSFNLLDGLTSARRQLLQDKAISRTLHVVSDFRESDWGEQAALSRAIKELDQSEIAVNLVRTVTEAHTNIAVVGLTGELQSAAVNVPLQLTATLRNFGSTKSDNLRLTVIQDGKPASIAYPVDAIEAGATTTKKIEVKFGTPGRHRIEVAIDHDALREDNSRHLVVDLLDTNPVLLITGGEDESDAERIADALAADPSLTGISPLIQSPEYLRRSRLDTFRVIYILGVANLPADAILPLQNYVKAGGGLVWYVGEAVDPNFYNEKLYGEDGIGLFPVKLGRTWADLPRADELSPGPDVSFVEHPIFSIFSGESNPYVATVHIDRFYSLADDFPRRDTDRADGVKTIATLRNQQPLMFEHKYGEGKVITCLTTAGSAWNDWSQNPSFVVLQIEMQMYLAKVFEKIEPEVVGTPIALSVSAAAYSDEVEFATPDERVSRTKMVTKTVPPPEGESETSSEVLLETTFRETDQPGVYRVTLADPDQRPDERWIAYNVPLTDAGLALASREELKRRIDANFEFQSVDNFDWIRQRDAQQEVRLTLIIILLAVMMAEQFLAYRLSYHTSRAGAIA